MRAFGAQGLGSFIVTLNFSRMDTGLDQNLIDRSNLSKGKRFPPKRQEEIIYRGDLDNEGHSAPCWQCLCKDVWKGRSLFWPLVFEDVRVRTLIWELSDLLKMHSDNIFQGNENVPKSPKWFLLFISQVQAVHFKVGTLKPKYRITYERLQLTSWRITLTGLF